MRKRFWRHMAALLYPPKCPVCGEFLYPEEGFCNRCREKLLPYEGGFEVKNADGFFAPFLYTEESSPAVVQLKRNIGSNAPYAFGVELAELLKAGNIAEKLDFILPVPMHKKAFKERGFDQALLIAKVIGRELNLPVRSDIAVKSRETAAQKTLTKNERLVNLRGAFSIVKKGEVSGKSVLILDDVCTTGSTMTEIAGLLRQCVAAKVYCAACCKTPVNYDKNDT